MKTKGMATTQKQCSQKRKERGEGRYKGKKKGNMQETDVSMEIQMQETHQKCIFVQNVYHKCFDSRKNQNPKKKKMKIGIRGEMRGLHKMKDYNLRK